MEEIIPCAVKDQEVFRRVWQRVMGDRAMDDCPVEALPGDLQGDLSCECLEELARQSQADPSGGQSDQASEDAAGAGWEAREPQNQELMGRDDTMTREQMTRESEQMAEIQELKPQAETAMAQMTAPQEQPDRTGRMRRQVMEALEGWQFYRHLARRARGGGARILNTLAGDEHQAARKLAAAYFLLTGIRYWPSGLLGTPAIPSYWGALRNRHQAEQRREADYRASAGDWDGSDQQELYRTLAEGAQERCRALRTLLEEDHMM